MIEFLLQAAANNTPTIVIVTVVGWYLERGQQRITIRLAAIEQHLFGEFRD